MITLAQYVGKHAGSPDWTPARQGNAVDLLVACAKLEQIMLNAGVIFPDNPATRSGVSGLIFGGFRPQSCPQGAPHSSHKEGQGVDRYDPHNLIDKWLADDYAKHGKKSAIVRCGIYIEHPNATDTWSHWTTRPPKSGNRIFIP